jgi:hypothetical protein
MTGPTSEHAKRSHNTLTHESEIRAVWRALCVVDRFGDNDNDQFAKNLARGFWHNACGIQKRGSHDNRVRFWVVGDLTKQLKSLPGRG